MAIEKKFKILIYPGLHSRPGTEWVKFISEFSGNIEISKGDKSGDGRSLMALFKLLPKQFEEINIKLTGENEEQFMEEIKNWETKAFLNEDDYKKEGVEESILRVFEEIE
jgi:phosphotransferase system HPr (HPr) family protein